MGRTLESLIAELPPARRAWVEAKGRQMADDMIRYAEAHGVQDLVPGQDQADGESQDGQPDVELDSDPSGPPS